MSMRSYSLDTTAAKQADFVGARITETGKYTGKFIRAEAVTSNQGTEGIELCFKSDDGQEADFLQLWTHRPNGDELPSNKTLMALMTCMKVRSVNPKKGLVDKWDADAKAKVSKEAIILPELVGKPIGLLLQKEEYEKRGGGVGFKFNVYGCFDPDGNFTASEILDKAATPEKLDKMMASLRDKLLSGNSSRPTSGSGSKPSGSVDEFEDDIPF
jgi:hypothetical protein